MLINVFRPDWAWPPSLASVKREIAPGFFVDVGLACNFRCLFCSVEVQPHFEPLADLLALVETAGRHGLGQGFFTGGEPLLLPSLEEVMAHGRRHGVPQYGISTNGWGLNDKVRMAELSRLGMRVWKLSWDDHRPEVLDRLRGHRGITARLHEGLEVLHGLPDAVVGIYQVLVAENRDHLPDMVRSVVELRREFPRLGFLMVALVKPVGQALVNTEVLFDPTTAGPVLAEALAIAREHHLPLGFNNVPACLLPSSIEDACSTWEHLGIYDSGTRRTRPMRFPGANLVKNSRCLGCAAFEGCNGYFGDTTDRYGDEGFCPTGALRRDLPLPASALEDFGRIEEELKQLAQPDGGRTTPGPAGPGRAVLVFEVEGPDGVVLKICVASGETTPQAYARTAAHALWYEGRELSRDGETLLRALTAFVAGNPDVVDAALS